MRGKFASVMIILAVLFLSGCAAVLLGGGVAGGMAIGKDTMTIEKDTNFNRAWKITLRALEEMGYVQLQDSTAGIIEADIKDSKVTVMVTQITPATVRVEVKARKNMLPNMDLVVEITNKINSKL